MMAATDIANGIVSDKEISSMSSEDLKQRITDFKGIISTNDNKEEYIKNEHRMKELRNDIKQKKLDLKSIANDINKYFSDRTQIIANNNELSESLNILRMEFNEQMYKMENIKLLLQKKQNEDKNENENNKNEQKLSEIEKLRRKHNKIFTQIRNSYNPQNDDNEINIDQLIEKRNILLSEITNIEKEYNKLKKDKNRKITENKIYSELINILSSIYSMRESRKKREEILISSIKNRKKQQINTEILDEKRKKQKEILYDKLEGIESELIEYTNLNIYGSPSVSVRNSITSFDKIDNISIISDSSQIDINEMQQNINNLIQYLQDFLPLRMRKQIEKLKIKSNDIQNNNNNNNGNNDDLEEEIDRIFGEMTMELQRKQFMQHMDMNYNEKEITHYYLNHNMNIFDEFDKLDIKIPLILSDIPHSIKALMNKMYNFQQMNKFFAVV